MSSKRSMQCRRPRKSSFGSLRCTLPCQRFRRTLRVLCYKMSLITNYAMLGSLGNRFIGSRACVAAAFAFIGLQMLIRLSPQVHALVPDSMLYIMSQYPALPMLFIFGNMIIGAVNKTGAFEVIDADTGAACGCLGHPSPAHRVVQATSCTRSSQPVPLRRWSKLSRRRCRQALFLARPQPTLRPTAAEQRLDSRGAA